MDFNLNDFSGIQNDESQFMDESNVNINNVWQHNDNSPIQLQTQKSQQEQKQPTEQNLISLQDLNFGDNLMDMSRISNHQAQEMTQKEADIIHSLQNNQDFDQFDMQTQNFAPIIEHKQPKLKPAQSAPVVLDSENTYSAPTSEWKKPVIQKKKRFGGKKPPKAETKVEVPQPVANQWVADQSDLNIDDILIDMPLISGNFVKAPSAPIQQAAFESRTQNNKYARDSPEPQPLFDCLFCVGIHEHLVLQTVKEKNLKYIYGENVQKANVEIEEEEDYKDIDRAFAISCLKFDQYKKVKIEKQRESLIDANYEVPSVYASKRHLIELCQKQIYKNPMLATIYKFVDRVAQISTPQINANVAAVAPTRQTSGTYQVTATQQYAQQQISEGGSSMCNEDLMVSNMLENFEDIDPEEQSMFMNLNIRNRRQKILHNVSFESELYDIYCPVFTSDEESISSNSKSSLTSSRESEQIRSGSRESQSLSSKESGESDSSSADSQASPDIQSLNTSGYDSSNQNSNLSQEMSNDMHKKIKENKLNEGDLDYNSENNNSSLSSIHRDIQEAPAEESSNYVVLQDGQLLQPNQAHIIRNMGGKLTLEESGGCQVEEMQDDTVMKQCKSMFRSRAAGQQQKYDNIPNESFKDQIFQQRKIHLANQLESLDQKEMMHLELMNLESSPSKINTIQTDIELIPSIARSTQKKGSGKKNQIFKSKSRELGQQEYLMDSFSQSTGHKKKETGRFNTKQLQGSAKFENIASVVSKKLQTKLIGGNNSISESKKNFNEDDSIIQILPGFTSSHLKNANSGYVNDSAMNQMSQDIFNTQQAVGLTIAFGAESLIQPINYLPEETNQFLMEDIQEVNASGTSQQTPQRSSGKKSQNQIDFYNLNFGSSARNKLQIVDSGSEQFEMSPKDDEEQIQSLSPIAKNKDQSNQYMVEHQDSQPSSKKIQGGGNRINLAQIDNKGQTQKLNLKIDSPQQKYNMRTQKMVSRKTTSGQPAENDHHYEQKGNKQNVYLFRRSSNVSIGSKDHKRKGSQQFYYDGGISASTGALPGYDEMVATEAQQTLGTNDSQQYIEDTETKGKRSKSKRGAGSGIKQPTDLTPVKSRTSGVSKQSDVNSKTTKKQLAKKGSNIEVIAPSDKINQKAVTQKIKQLKLNQNNLQKKEANNKAGNYGMLSKEQKKLMLQLQNKADEVQTKGPKKQKESNQKNVRDNYFKVASSDLIQDEEMPASQSKTAMKNKPQPVSLYSKNEKNGVLNQKRSSTNLKNRSRERSSEMNQKKNNVDNNMYRGSMVDVNIYSQNNPKMNQMIQHQAAQSQSVGKGNEMLILEQRQNSEPQMKPLITQKSITGSKGIGVPSLNLETVNTKILDIGDQFLQTMGNIQNPKSSLNKFVKVQQNQNQKSTQNLNLKIIQKPIGDFAFQNNNKFFRQIKYQQVQQQLKTQSLTEPPAIPDTDRVSLEQILEVNQVSSDVTQSYLHSSTGQLQNFSVQQIPKEEKHLFKNMISKIENYSLFAGGDQFVIPAQSHRNPARTAQQKLSISAGKNIIGVKNKNDFMKSTANLKKDFSEIQSKDNDTYNETHNPNKHGYTSKLSIEQDIKFLKMSLNNEKNKQQSVEKQTKAYVNSVGQNNRARKAQLGAKNHDNIDQSKITLPESSGLSSQVSNSIRKSRVSSLENKEKRLGRGDKNKLLRYNKSPTKVPSLQIQTKPLKTKFELSSGTVSTKSNKVVFRKIKQDRVDTETSEQKQLGQTHVQIKQQNYKKLILENNMKILQYQKKSQNQTPKQGNQMAFMTNKQNILLDVGAVTNPGKKQMLQQPTTNVKHQFMNKLAANQFQTTKNTGSNQSNGQYQPRLSGENLESNFSSMPQMIHKDSQSSGKSANYRQLQNKQQIAITKDKANMQYFKTNEYGDNNTLEVYNRSDDDHGFDGSGLGHISSGEQQIGQMTREKLNNAQFNSSAANKSNSLFSGASGYPTNQQKASGSGILGQVSIGGGLGSTGVNYGGANTTANTNSYLGFGNHTNNKSGIQNSSGNQRSLLNNLVADAQDSQQNQKSGQTRKKMQSMGNKRLAKQSSMKVSQENLEF